MSSGPKVGIPLWKTVRSQNCERNFATGTLGFFYYHEKLILFLINKKNKENKPGVYIRYRIRAKVTNHGTVPPCLVVDTYLLTDAI